MTESAKRQNAHASDGVRRPAPADCIGPETAKSVFPGERSGGAPVAVDTDPGDIVFCHAQGEAQNE